MTREQIDYIESEEFVEGFKCLELEVPWIAPKAIYKVEEALRRDDIVLEVGSGGSTLFFGERCDEVAVIETNPEWGAKVVKAARAKGLVNMVYNEIEKEENIIELIKTSDTDGIAVFSVDPQGGYNRSKILNAFLDKGISPSLRMIILDNYAHEGIFPDHYNRIMAIGYGWEYFEYGHPRWAGLGTKIYLKTK